MAQKGIANAAIEIGNTLVSIVPNTCTYDEGGGEQSVKAQANGSASAEVVIFDNAESKLSMIKFSVFPTIENIEFFRSVKYGGQTTVRLFDQDTGFTRTMVGAYLVNNYEIALQSDGNIPLEFSGTPVV